MKIQPEYFNSAKYKFIFQQISQNYKYETEKEFEADYFNCFNIQSIERVCDYSLIPFEQQNIYPKIYIEIILMIKQVKIEYKNSVKFIMDVINSTKINNKLERLHKVVKESLSIKTRRFYKKYDNDERNKRTKNIEEIWYNSEHEKVEQKELSEYKLKKFRLCKQICNDCVIPYTRKIRMERSKSIDKLFITIQMKQQEFLDEIIKVKRKELKLSVAIDIAKSLRNKSNNDNNSHDELISSGDHRRNKNNFYKKMMTNIKLIPDFDFNETIKNACLDIENDTILIDSTDVISQVIFRNSTNLIDESNISSLLISFKNKFGCNPIPEIYPLEQQQCKILRMINDDLRKLLLETNGNFGPFTTEDQYNMDMSSMLICSKDLNLAIKLLDKTINLKGNLNYVVSIEKKVAPFTFAGYDGLNDDNEMEKWSNKQQEKIDSDEYSSDDSDDLYIPLRRENEIPKYKNIFHETNLKRQRKYELEYRKPIKFSPILLKDYIMKDQFIALLNKVYEHHKKQRRIFQELPHPETIRLQRRSVIIDESEKSELTKKLHNSVLDKKQIIEFNLENGLKMCKQRDYIVEMLCNYLKRESKNLEQDNISKSSFEKSDEDEEVKGNEPNKESDANTNLNGYSIVVNKVDCSPTITNSIDIEDKNKPTNTIPIKRVTRHISERVISSGINSNKNEPEKNNLPEIAEETDSTKICPIMFTVNTNYPPGKDPSFLLYNAIQNLQYNDVYICIL